MDVFGNLVMAQLENVAANPTSGIQGRVVYNTVTKRAQLDTGNQYVSLGGGAAPPVRFRNYQNGPNEAFINGIQLFDFSVNGDQEVWASIKVPSDYVAGLPITLEGGLFACNQGSGFVRFAVDAYLMKSASSILGTPGTPYQSTNAKVSVPSTLNRLTAIGSIDLTSSTGTINGVAVAAADLILARLYRDIVGEVTPANEDARFLVDSLTSKFSP